MKRYRRLAWLLLPLVVLPIMIGVSWVVIQRTTEYRSQAAATLTSTAPLSRGAMAAYLMDVFAISPTVPSTPSFSDVSSTHQNYKAIETIFAQKITMGCAANPLRFCPDRQVTRAEATTFILRAAKIQVTSEKIDTPYADLVGHPLQKYVDFSRQIGLTKPCDIAKNTYCPDELVSQSEVQRMVDAVAFLMPKRPMRWIQPNIHPDKQTIWETALAYPELWDNTFKNIDVLGIFIYSVDANREGYLDKLSQVVKKYNLKLNVELAGLMMTTSCGDQKGEESAALSLSLLKPLYDRGLKVDYLSLDGSALSGISMMGCDSMQMALREQEVVDYIRLIHKQYPDIKIGLLPNFPHWQYKDTPNYFATSELPDYAVVFEDLVAKLAAAGEKIDFVLVDNPYDYATGKVTSNGNRATDWVDRIVRLEHQVERHSIPFGLIFNSESGGATSDEQFYNDTMAYKTLYKDHGGTPGIMMIESWYKYPTVHVPDTKAFTFTRLVSDFFEFGKSSDSRVLTRGDAAVEIAKLFHFEVPGIDLRKTFDDVSLLSSNHNAIEIIADKKITSGCATSPLRFCPDRQLQRGEAVTFLLRTAGISPQAVTTVTLKDVPSTYPLYAFITFAVDKGISIGCNRDGNYCPEDVVSLAEWNDLATRVFDVYHLAQTCPVITRCSTAYSGKQVSFTPDHRTGCYAFTKFPIYPLTGYTSNSCPVSRTAICYEDKSCCTVQKGLDNQSCN